MQRIKQELPPPHLTAGFKSHQLEIVCVCVKAAWANVSKTRKMGVNVSRERKKRCSTPEMREVGGLGVCRLLSPLFSLIWRGEQSTSEHQQAACRQWVSFFYLPLVWLPYLFPSPPLPPLSTYAPSASISFFSLASRLFPSPLPLLPSPLINLPPCCFSPPLSLPISLLPSVGRSHLACIYCFISSLPSLSLSFCFIPPTPHISPIPSPALRLFPFCVLSPSLISSFPLFLTRSPPAGLFSRLSSAVAAVLLIQPYSFKWPKSSVWRNLTLIAFFSFCLSRLLFMHAVTHKYTPLIDLWELASSFSFFTFFGQIFTLFLSSVRVSACLLSLQLLYQYQ